MRGTMGVTVRGVDVCGQSRSETFDFDMDKVDTAVTEHSYSEYKVEIGGCSGENATIALCVPWLNVTTPRRRRTRSGREIYGAHPSLGLKVWTSRPDDKIERRRVRSRLAQYAREEKKRERFTVAASFADEIESFPRRDRDDMADALRFRGSYLRPMTVSVVSTL